MNDYRICGTCMVALPTTEQAKLYNEKLGKNVMKPAVAYVDHIKRPKQPMCWRHYLYFIRSEK